MIPWWQEKPIRLVQTNLREIDADEILARDPRQIVREVREFGGNTILFSVGGIVSFYPSTLKYQTPIPVIAGNSFDFVGEALDEAHKLGLRFIARLDLSKCHRHVYEARPEWFFRRADGLPQTYNGLYSTCVNGGYYQEYGFEIMREILARYDVDAFFFNQFGYKSWDYSGNYHGLCQCVNCQRRFAEMYGHPLPQVEDRQDPIYLDYIEFKRRTTDELTQAVADFIHQKPNTALVNYQVKFADVVRSESNSAVDRPLPMWQFSGSDNTKRVRGSFSDKPSANAAVYFVDIPYRFAAVSPHQTALRLAQDLAYGGDIDLYVLGTLDQEDRVGLSAAKRVYAFAAEHADTYRGLVSLAEVLLLYPDRSYAYGASSRTAYQGMFRLLSEQHVPFDCAHDFVLDGVWAQEAKRATDSTQTNIPPARFRLDRYKLLILPGAACLSDDQLAAIDAFVKQGGRVLATGETALYTELGRSRPGYGLDSLGVSAMITRRDDMRSAYFRHTDAGYASELLFLDKTYLYPALKKGATTSLNLIPPAIYGPPEKCFINKLENDLPGVVWFEYGQGKTAYLPWFADSLYHRHSAPGHQELLASCVHALLDQPQIVTDANPQVEFALLGAPGRFVLNMVNVSGHHGTAFFEPVTMHNLSIKVRLPESVRGARSLKLGIEIEISQEGPYTCLTLPKLDLFDTIVLDFG